MDFSFIESSTGRNSYYNIYGVLDRAKLCGVTADQITAAQKRLAQATGIPSTGVAVAITQPKGVNYPVVQISGQHRMSKQQELRYVENLIAAL